MKIFYIDLADCQIPEISRPEKKQLQSKLGRFIVDYVGKNVYNIQDCTVIKQNFKPKFAYSNICFNISHSNEIIAAAFDSYPLGIDVEFMRERNFHKLSAHYGINFDDKKSFYLYWTKLEAKIKIQADIKQEISFKVKENYMLSLLSANPDKTNFAGFEIYKIKISFNKFSDNSEPVLTEIIPVNKKLFLH